MVRVLKLVTSQNKQALTPHVEFVEEEETEEGETEGEQTEAQDAEQTDNTNE